MHTLSFLSSALAVAPSPGLRWLMGGLLYLSPETALPVASIIAAVIGVLLMFGRNLWAFVKRVVRRMTGRAADAAPEAPAAPDMPEQV